MPKGKAADEANRRLRLRFPTPSEFYGATVNHLMN
jgi:hypothetical protein